jgi:hypothetical protein
MLEIGFKNLAVSELAKDAVCEKIDPVLEAIPELSQAKCLVTLEVKKSSRESGPDFFKAHFKVEGGPFHGLSLEKQALSLYVALGDLAENLLQQGNKATLLSH